MRDCEPTLSEPQQPPETVTGKLNDYVYVDRERIAAYHTQILGSGTPLQSKFTESYAESSGKSGEAGLGQFLRGKLTGGVTSTDSSERTFDQGWPMILTTMSELSARGQIHDGALGVPVGSIVRVRGFLQIVDMHLLADLWGPMTAMFKKQMAQHLPPGLSASSLSDFIKTVPHPLVAQVVTSVAPHGEPLLVGPESLIAWGVLSPEHVVGNASAFLTMNGGFFSGEYSMIAVLDVGAISTPEANPLENFQPNGFFDMAFAMQHTVRMMFGRPASANGVTPLMIYRRLIPSNASDSALSSP